MKRTLLLLLLCGRGGWGEDLEYRQVASVALHRNLSQRVSDLEIKVAEARHAVAEAERLPRLTANGFYVHNEPPLVNALRPPRDYIQAGRSVGINASELYLTGQNQMLNRLVLSVPIYSGGRLESEMHRTENLVHVEEWRNRRERQQLAYRAKKAYLQVLLSDARRDVAETSLARALELKRVVQSKLDSGVTSAYDLRQAEVAVANAQDRLFQSESALLADRAELNAVLDKPVDFDLHLLDRLSGSQLRAAEPDVSTTDLEQLVATALQQRPELEQLRQELLVNTEEANLAISGTLPRLSVNLNYDLIGFTGDLHGGMSFISSLSVPIYDGGVSGAKLEELKYRKVQLQGERLQQAESVAVETVKAATRVRLTRERLQTARAAESEAQQALRLALLRYDVGAGVALDALNAQASLAAASFQVAEARFDEMESRAALTLALGGTP